MSSEHVRTYARTNIGLETAATTVMTGGLGKLYHRHRKHKITVIAQQSHPPTLPRRIRFRTSRQRGRSCTPLPEEPLLHLPPNVPRFPPFLLPAYVRTYVRTYARKPLPKLPLLLPPLLQVLARNCHYVASKCLQLLSCCKHMLEIATLLRAHDMFHFRGLKCKHLQPQFHACSRTMWVYG